MRKIKFKTEYVPLSDEVINRHKNFEQLMGAYVAAPKPNWFKQFIQKKWTMFGGGLMTGAIITSLLWYNQNETMRVEPVVQQTSNEREIQEENKNNTAAIFDSSIRSNEKKGTKDVVENPEATTTSASPKITGDDEQKIKESTAVTSSSKTLAEKTNKSPIGKPVNDLVTNSTSVAQDHASVVNAEEKIQAGEQVIYGDEKPMVIPDVVALVANEKSESEKAQQTASEISNEVQPESNAVSSIALITDSATKETKVMIGPPAYINAVDDTEELAAIDSTKGDKNNLSLPVVATGAVIAASPDVSAVTPSSKEKNEKIKKEKPERTSEKDSSAVGPFAFLGLALFNKDTTGNEKPKEAKKGWFVFGKDSSEKQLAAKQPKDSLENKKEESSVNEDSLYIQRYAQVSFITPLSSNGIDGYKYMHYVSLNVLQGYSGALRGAEFGGLLNGDKGYVMGAQFAGLGNYAGGYLKGAQFAGLANVSQSVRGAQFSGITNVSGSFVSGFQATGVVNVSTDSLNGFQAAGVVNILSSEKKSQSWQVAGVGNVSLAQSKGGQIAGVFNVANQLIGGQIGLINFGKNIKGFQIGLINISDTIDGAPIGLVSVSAHGIFDVNVWTSDFLAFNAGVRVGSKYVYNIYSYGVSPFNDDLPFGFGVGIGGHIPLKRAFIDIDGMAWSMHHSYISFAEINMINQLRVMGGFTINKYLSVYGGPTLNISVQDNRYQPFLNNYFFENVNENTTVRMAPGFVIGIRAF